MDEKATKIAVGMSGGVDSALAAVRLKEQGHEIIGVYLDCWDLPSCATDKDRRDALKVGVKFKIAMKVLDFRKEYKEKVMEDFFRELKKGRTPNPDIWCNREIKFGMFLDWAIKNGFDGIATGHYARTKNGKLLKGKDKNKDQSYFLCMLNRKQLSKVVFPVGEMTKIQVRKEAKKRGIQVWNKKGTSGVCLVGGDLTFEDLIKMRVKEHEGEVVDWEGKIVGKHKGVEFYTIGQRHGFEVKNRRNDSSRKFVVRKDRENNRLVVGEKQDLRRNEFEVEKWHWIGESGKGNLEFRIRHQGELVKGGVEGKRVSLKNEVVGVAEGQIVAVYQDKECLGGGVIKG